MFVASYTGLIKMVNRLFELVFVLCRISRLLLRFVLLFCRLLQLSTVFSLLVGIV